MKSPYSRDDCLVRKSMSSPVNLTSAVGVSKDDLEYGSFRKWLKPIQVRATVHPDLSTAPREVGRALGFIIRREEMRRQWTSHSRYSTVTAG